jgi:hypothetical protein
VNIPEIEEIVAVLQVYVETPVRRDLDRVRPAIDSCPVFSRHGSDVDNHRICPPIAAYYYIALFFNDSHISGPKCRFGKQHSRSSLPPTRNAWRDGDTPTVARLHARVGSRAAAELRGFGNRCVGHGQRVMPAVGHAGLRTGIRSIQPRSHAGMRPKSAFEVRDRASSRLN